MTTPRKAHGYVDNAELHRAIRANKDGRRVVERILTIAQERPGSSWIYPLIAKLAQTHSVALEALTEMERIREKGA